MKRTLIALAACLSARTLGAQSLTVTTTESRPMIIVGDGWEAFPNVEYQGGDARFPKKKFGMLVLTDSTIGFYECTWTGCLSDKKKNMIRDTAQWIVRLAAITEVSSSTATRGASVTGRVAFGVLASDRTEEFFGFVHETATSAEAPVFKADSPNKTQAGALEAKLRFRLKKAGVKLSSSAP